MADVAAKSTPRRVTIKKRDDFDGYGFNLHAEKGKAGQYVGKVDANSPAEQAGLREGDRILEVNGVDIGAETHKQVVERIKAVPNETTLLVMDPNPITIKTQANGNTKKSEKDEKKDDKKEELKKDELQLEEEKSVNNNHTEMIAMENVVSKTKEIESNTISTNDNETGNEVSPTDKEASPIKDMNEASETSNNNHSTSEMIHSSSNGTTTSIDSNKNGTSTTATESSGLNLKMTAAELRAKLMAKKKYDPKNESIDLRKKYDIIEKM